jgi:DNA-binding MarR family transcriptional regulator
MATSLKKFIQEIAGKKAPGPSTTFTVFHVFYALELMSQKPLGRNKLAKKLMVGDGAVRTIISRLRKVGLIETSKEGCSLTEKGLEVWGQFEKVFPKRIEIPKSELNLSEFNFAFLVKNSGQKVGSGIDQRDAAIIAGARKALVIVFKDDHLRIESVSNSMEKDYPAAANQILKELTPANNDTIIIAGADSALKAKRGAFAASWSLISV